MARGGISQAQSRNLGRAVMALSVLQALVFFVAASRRSYVAVAIPVGIIVGTIGGIGFWIGYTMATTDWDEPADYVPGE